VFFRSADREALMAWYRDHLGVDISPFGSVFLWREHENPDEVGYTVWGPFPRDTAYFGPGPQSFMVNYRVRDLDGMIQRLRSAGVEVVGEIEEHPNGRFAWVVDPDGRRIELWEPVPAAEDPYL